MICKYVYSQMGQYAHVRERKIGHTYTLTANLVCFQLMVDFEKPSEFYTAKVSILQRSWAHNSTCISGFRGTVDVVDTDTEMVDEDSVALYLGYDV